MNRYVTISSLRVLMWEWGVCTYVEMQTCTYMYILSLRTHIYISTVDLFLAREWSLERVMYIYVYIYTYIYMFIHTFIWIYLYWLVVRVCECGWSSAAGMHLCIYIHEHMYAYMNIHNLISCSCFRTSIVPKMMCLSVCFRLWMWICTRTRYIGIYLYICTSGV